MSGLNGLSLQRAALRAALALAAVMAVGTLEATPASAQGAWCANYSGRAGGTNCGFYTWEQCRATVSGVGGFCTPSPWATYYADQPLPRRKVRRPYR
jgi:hypothetical protein